MMDDLERLRWARSRGTSFVAAVVIAAGLGGCDGDRGAARGPVADPAGADATSPVASTASPEGGDTDAASATSPSPTASPATEPVLVFEDATAASGIRFVHDPAPSEERSYPEIIGSGAAVLDFDGDGDLDLYLVQGGRIPGTEFGTPQPNRLLRNDGGGRFTDVTATAGAAGDLGFGMGAIAVDLEGDGDQDLFITNVGPDVLLRNEGDGTFTDVTAAAGVGGDGYSLGAVFFDFDGDGHLDLYVADYVQWRPGIDPECFSARGTRDYCGPANYAGRPDRLYRNRGDGTFEDVSQSSGIASVATRSMGVVAADFDGDGLVDIFVANDGEPNLLWRNGGDGTFTEEAAIRGCAVNGDGLAEASMGVAIGDPDDDGDFDLLVTHLQGETHTFYRNDGGWFTDATLVAGITSWSRPDTGFGVEWADLDHDGDEEIVVANGAVMLPMQPRDPQLPYAEPDRLVLGDGARWTRSVPLPPPLPGGRAAMGRGLVSADFDGDGRLDLLFTNNRGPAQLLLNRSEGVGVDDWIGFRLVAPGPNRDAVGATIRVPRGEATETRLVSPYRGFLGSHDPVVRVGLGRPGHGGEGGAAIVATVRWPDGVEETFAGLARGRVHELQRGTGEGASDGAG